MHKRLFTLLICCATFFLTGCFELLEVVNLKEDGSGSTKLYLNLSMSKDVVREFMSKDSVQGVKVPSPQKIKDGLEYARVELEKVPGLHNPSYKLNMEDYALVFTVDFDSVEVLNNAYNILLKDKDILKDLFQYKMDDHVFSRSVSDKALEKLNSYYSMLTLYGIQEAKFTSIVRNERSIDSASEAAKVSSSGTSLVEKKTIQQLINKQHTQLTVRFR